MEFLSAQVARRDLFWSDGVRQAMLSLMGGALAGNMKFCREWSVWFREAELMARFNEIEKAFLRSQSGPLAGAALAVPTSFHTRLEPHLFRMLFLCRLRLLLFRLHLFADVAAYSYHWPPSSCKRAGKIVVKTWVRSGWSWPAKIC